LRCAGLALDLVAGDLQDVDRGEDMKYDELVKRVAEQAETDRSAARSVLESTLAVLSQRIDAGEASDLAAQLPEEVAWALRGAERDAEPFTAEELVRRVAERESLAPNDADKRVRAVLAGLQEAVSAGVLEHVLSQLSTDYLGLMAGTPRS
jgi:uncharacterized protein (DUF2267 family)